MSPEDWERLLVSEGLGVVHPHGRGLVEYEDWKHGAHGGQTLGDVYLPDKEEDDPALVDARREIAAIAARLPSRWAVVLTLRSRGMSQGAIGRRMAGRGQPSICQDLQRLHAVLPSLLATRPVTADEISEWVAWPRPGLRWLGGRVGEIQREALVAEYTRCWCSSHAAYKVGMIQSCTRKALVLSAEALPEHPVSKLLSVINRTRFDPASRLGPGKGHRPMAERVADSDYSRFLVE
jgi:hypothetical protein